MQLDEARRDGWRRLEAAGCASAALDSRLLLAHVLDLDHAAFIREQTKPVPKAAMAVYDDLLTKRATGMPLAHLTGRQEFWSLSFAVNDATLIPRGDSETLIEAVLEARVNRSKDYRILDLGTGSGCLLLALLSEFPEAWGLGLDRSKAALDMARHNAHMLGLEARTAFMHGDWASGLRGQFDIVVANPPYVRRDTLPSLAPDVRDWEPHSALDGGADGLDAYRAILTQLPSIMAPGALAILETGWDQKQMLDDLIALTNCYGPPRWYQDLAGHPRCVMVWCR